MGSDRLLGHREPQKAVKDPGVFHLEHRELEENMLTQWVTNHLILLVLKTRQRAFSRRGEEIEAACPASRRLRATGVFDLAVGHPF